MIPIELVWIGALEALDNDDCAMREWELPAVLTELALGVLANGVDEEIDEAENTDPPTAIEALETIAA